MATQGMPVAAEATTECKEASDALKYALISIVCFGIILAPMALSKASKARKMMAMNPQLTGSGKATAATVIASVVMVLWVLGLLFRAMNH
jgi:hypothetical protein